MKEAARELFCVGEHKLENSRSTWDRMEDVMYETNKSILQELGS